MRKSSACLIALTVWVATVVAVPVARASFEGRNGKIAFSRSGSGYGISVMRPDGTNAVRLTGRKDFQPVWSPDGTMIAFLRWNADFSSSWIMVMNADGTNKHRVGTPSTGDGCAVQPPHWSYDGLFLAYTDDCFDRDPRVAQIRVATVAGDAELEVTDYSSGNGLSRQPWSPSLEESSQLAFVSNRDGDGDVYVMNSDGTGVTQVTTDGDDQFDAIWSPAGGSIAYATQVITRSGSAQSSIMKIDPSGTNETTVVAGNPQVTEPLWSPDGSRLAATRRTRLGNATAIVVDADGSNELTIGKDYQTSGAAWAPNSGAIVFATGELIRFRFTATGVTSKTLTATNADETSADWQALPN